MRFTHLAMMLGLVVLPSATARAGSIGAVMEHKRLPEATTLLIDPRTGTSVSSGDALGVRVAVGDIILFRLAFLPGPDQGTRGIQSYLTEYLPPNTRIVGVRIIDAQGNTIAPHYPGLGDYGCESGCTSFVDLPSSTGPVTLDRGSIAQLYADTGIFYASDTEVRLARDPGDQLISLTTGTLMSPEPVGVAPLKLLLGVGDAGAAVFVHNAWDWTQVLAFGTSTAMAGNAGYGETPFGYGSPVAGPQTYYPYEATDVGGAIHFDNVIGPWNRIRFPGSKIGLGPANATGPDPATGFTYARAIRDPSGAEIGRDITPASPVSARALRWALGDTRAGVAQLVEVALEVTALPLDPNVGTGADVDCAEVTGSPLATKRAGTTTYGLDNPWGTYLASPACANLRLQLDVNATSELASQSNIAFNVHAKNLTLTDATGVVIEQRWDALDLDYVSTDSGPNPDGAPTACTDDATQTCLRWSVGTMAAADEVRIETTYYAKDSPGTHALTVRYYSNEWPSPGYDETRDVYVQEPLAIPAVALAPVADPTTTPASPSATYALIGTVANLGNAAGLLAELNPSLPAGWSLAGNQITLAGTPVTCTSTIPERPQCPIAGYVTAGAVETLSLSVNVPSGASTALYDLDVQVWMDSFETYFDRIATVPVGAPRTSTPTVDCPITSDATSITGTTEDGADVTLSFNLMERGFGNEAPSGDSGAWSIDNFDYFAPPSFGRLYGGLEVSATAQAAGKLPSARSNRCTITPACPYGEPVEQTCDDGIDNDCDGLIDCADSDCGNQSCDAYGKTCAAGACQCPTGATTESQCSDSQDDDCDGLVDCADTDCAGLACGANGRVCAALTCACPGTETLAEITCDDGVDNDCDGLIDCADSDCAGQACAANGFVCQGSTCVCGASGAEDDAALCSDNSDNDCDGVMDCDDPDCATQWSVCPAASETLCGDGIDNDGDAATDCADSDCAAAAACVDAGNDAPTPAPASGCSCSSSRSPDASMALLLLLGLVGTGRRRRPSERRRPAPRGK